MHQVKEMQTTYSVAWTDKGQAELREMKCGSSLRLASDVRRTILAHGLRAQVWETMSAVFFDGRIAIRKEMIEG